MVRCTEHTASIWQWLASLFVSKHQIDQSREAKLTLQTAVLECDDAENKLMADLKVLAKKVKDSQARHLQTQTKALLMSSRQKRKTLQVIQKKRITLQQQQETLESCELNEKVIKSMKQSSALLKTAGLEAQMKGIDETVMDMQENMQVADEITSALGESLSTNSELTDDEMQKELEVLFEEDFYQPVEIPLLKNSMPSAETEPVKKSEEVVLETVVEEEMTNENSQLIKIKE